MVEVKWCPLCLSKYVGEICTSCEGKGLPKMTKKVEGKGK
uniref:Uncharacterized protein n=1 Tax=viral metagenome TaxID=1070528 RepID=A0A6H1ZCT8_9ZZZZ